MWTTDLIWEIQVLEKTLKDEYKCNSRENKLVGGENLFSRRWKNWWWSLVQGNWRPLNLCFPGDALQPQDILWLWWKFNWLGDVCEPLLWGEFILFFTSCSWISFLPSHWVLFFFSPVSTSVCWTSGSFLYPGNVSALTSITELCCCLLMQFYWPYWNSRPLLTPPWRPKSYKDQAYIQGYV